ncbi:hypothetical protein SCMC78_23060 [Streptomyces sp. CMC78]|uniref:Glycosyl transferase family 1 domain-containing protein n=1 Tax=Streptomyces sp. CMC78 TaxID=3231512 RepID=A0AB33KFH6_9ACTN
MTSDLAPAILVLNDRYLPQDSTAAATVGATSFALDVMRCLRDAGAFAGVLLYRRKEGLTEPVLRRERKEGVACQVLEFNFAMPEESVRGVVSEAVETIGAEFGATTPPMLYFQTDTLLRYTPEGVPACVTHHGPFYEDFAHHFSPAAAAEAFGSAQNALHFRDQQQVNLAELASRKDLFVIQHSRIQRTHLVERGVEEDRIREISPPVPVARTPTPELPPELDAFTSSGHFLLYTAAARLDYFKNLELLVDAGKLLMEAGLPAKVLVIGGSAEDETDRKELLKDVPAKYADRFLATARLPKEQLYGLFRSTRGRAVFVFPSRYETLGITPLEAAMHGATTTVPDSPCVEVARFFPAELRFVPTAEGLAHTLQRLHTSDIRKEGELLRRAISKQVSTALFSRGLLDAWRTFTAMASAKAADLDAQLSAAYAKPPTTCGT